MTRSSKPARPWPPPRGLCAEQPPAGRRPPAVCVPSNRRLAAGWPPAGGGLCLWLLRRCSLSGPCSSGGCKGPPLWWPAGNWEVPPLVASSLVAGWWLGGASSRGLPSGGRLVAGRCLLSWLRGASPSCRVRVLCSGPCTPAAFRITTLSGV